MRRVAIGANRGLQISAGNCVAVCATLVVVVYLGVAGAAGFRDIGLERGAGWIVVAQDAVGSVAALAIGCDQQAFLVECEAMNRIHVVRIDAGQTLLRSHGPIAVALAAGLRHIERIDGRTSIRLGEDLMRIAMTARARMLLRRGVYAARKFRGLVCVAGLAVDLDDMIGVRILLDIGVAVVALQATVNAGAELVSVDRDAVALRIGHALVAVTGETVSLRNETVRRDEARERKQPEGGCFSVADCPGQIGQPFGWTNKDCDQKCCESCGFGHAPSFLHVACAMALTAFPRHYTQGFRTADFSTDPNSSGGDSSLRKRLLRLAWQ